MIVNLKDITFEIKKENGFYNVYKNIGSFQHKMTGSYDYKKAEIIKAQYEASLKELSRYEI